MMMGCCTDALTVVSARASSSWSMILQLSPSFLLPCLLFFSPFPLFILRLTVVPRGSFRDVGNFCPCSFSSRLSAAPRVGNTVLNFRPPPLSAKPHSHTRSAILVFLRRRFPPVPQYLVSYVVTSSILRPPLVPPSASRVRRRHPPTSLSLPGAPPRPAGPLPHAPSLTTLPRITFDFQTSHPRGRSVSLPLLHDWHPARSLTAPSLPGRTHSLWPPIGPDHCPPKCVAFTHDPS